MVARSDAAAGIVARWAAGAPNRFDWGKITWLFSGQITPDARQTVGYVVIEAGKKNPLHAHPNAEEVLYLIAGELDHSLDGALYRLGPGDAIRVPAGAKHDARAIGPADATMIVCYSTPLRQIVDYETKAGQTERE